MSQLAGTALDLRNSAALLKLARMSVDATPQPTGEPQSGDLAEMLHALPYTRSCLLCCRS